MAKVDDEQRFFLYKAIVEGLEFLINNTDPSSELASLIMGREHILDSEGYARSKSKLH